MADQKGNDKGNEKDKDREKDSSYASPPKPQRTAWRSASIEKKLSAAAASAASGENSAPSRTPPSNGYQEGRFGGPLDSPGIVRSLSIARSPSIPRVPKDREENLGHVEPYYDEMEKVRRQRETDEKERRLIEMRQGLHPLLNKYVFWYSRRQGPRNAQSSYEDTIRKLTECSTVEGFWCAYCHLARPSALPNSTDFHLFKEGIRPLWEDTANKHGGKWIVRFPKKLSGRFWEALALAIVGDTMEAGESVCGAVLSVRFGEDILSVWNRDANDREATMLLKDCIRRTLELPATYMMEYKPHDASLRDNSSFRNTWLKG